MGQSFAISVTDPVRHVDVEPGGTVVLKGSFHSTFDGSEVDAATTTWPDGAPGGASIDAGGLVDFDAGGFHLSARDPKTHEVTLLSTGRDGAACRAAHVASPCIVLRALPEARSRLITVDEWSRSLAGKMTAEVMTAEPPPAPPAFAPVSSAMSSPAGIGVAVGAALFVGTFASIMAWRQHKANPAYELVTLVRRLERKLAGADPALAAALRPPIDKARAALKKGAVDPGSREGARFRDALEHLEARLDTSREEIVAHREQEAADELIAEMQDAIAAAEETMHVSRARPRAELARG